MATMNNVHFEDREIEAAHVVSRQVMGNIVKPHGSRRESNVRTGGARGGSGKQWGNICFQGRVRRAKAKAYDSRIGSRMKRKSAWFSATKREAT